MGVSRSVTILITFFLTCLQKSPQLVIPFIPKTKNTWTDSVLYWIQQKRSISNPNIGFMKQLYDYEKNYFLKFYFFSNEDFSGNFILKIFLIIS